MIGVCFSGPCDDPGLGRPAPPAGPGALPRAAPAVQVRPRPRDEGEYPAHRTRLSKGKMGGDQGLLAHSEEAPGRGVPPAATGHAGIMQLNLSRNLKRRCYLEELFCGVCIDYNLENLLCKWVF